MLSNPLKTPHISQQQMSVSKLINTLPQCTSSSTPPPLSLFQTFHSFLPLLPFQPHYCTPTPIFSLIRTLYHLRKSNLHSSLQLAQSDVQRTIPPSLFFLVVIDVSLHRLSYVVPVYMHAYVNESTHECTLNFEQIHQVKTLAPRRSNCHHHNHPYLTEVRIWATHEGATFSYYCQTSEVTYCRSNSHVIKACFSTQRNISFRL